VFIHSNLGIEVAKSQAQARPPPAVTCIDIKSDNKPLEHRSRENGWSDVSSNDSLSSALSMSLVSSSLRQQILALYVSHHETASDSRLITDSRAWLTTLPAIPSPSKALETAAYAVSLARFGATLDAPSIKQEGLKLYSQGLRRTQMALEDPKSMYSDETLAACMLLGVYEIFECPDGSRGAYKSHFSMCLSKWSFSRALTNAFLLRWLCEAHSTSRAWSPHRGACPFHFSRIQIHGREYNDSLQIPVC
jgi:hypothetical protein